MSEESTKLLLNNEAATPGVLASHAPRFRLPGDLVAKATSALPDEQRSAIKWLATWCAESKLDLKHLEGRLKKTNGQPYSFASIYAVMTGRRIESGIGVAEFCEAIERFRRQVTEIEPAISTNFIHTELTKKMWRTCRRAFEKRRLTFILGESQIGKTTGMAEYARAGNHETVMLRMPTGGTMGDFLLEFCTRLYIPVQQHSRGELKRRIMDCFDERVLLIVDECHQALPSHYSDRGLLCLEFCREIHDRRKCGVVLCGTNVLREGILRGPSSKKLRQLWLRRFAPLQLPDKPSASVLDEFARAFGLPPAPDRAYQIGTGDQAFRKSPAALQNDIIERDGLGLWIKVLEEARDLAEEDKSKMQWRYVLEAYAEQVAFESGGL